MGIGMQKKYWNLTLAETKDGIRIIGEKMCWQAFLGDWYDATLIYAKFVYQEAKWLPVKGRPDTPDRFKNVPYWICNFMFNSEKQKGVKVQLLAENRNLDPDYWYTAAIRLKECLGTPVAYHVYNWHEIPFNINYPHFLPARDEFIRDAKAMRDAGIYIAPYINSVSCEMNDADEGREMNFDNTGIHGAAIMADGQPYVARYQQEKATGERTRLVPMCPGYHRWHQLIHGIVREMEDTLPIDGIYFDEINAHPQRPCRNRDHHHLPGEGNYWVQGYNQMIEKIRMGKPEDAFWFSEGNCEAYMNIWDGFLTWLCKESDDYVPAFPKIYSGYIQMLGRFTDGAKRDDDDIFRYFLADSLLYGQQLGWINASIIDHEKRMQFLEKIVKVRYGYTNLFNTGVLMRPPVIQCNVPAVETFGMKLDQVRAGVWKCADGSKTLLFVINLAREVTDVTVAYNAVEYAVVGTGKATLKMDPMAVHVVEL